MIPRKNQQTLKLGSKASADNKIAYANLIIGYAFEYGVNLDSRTISITGEIDAPWFDIVDAALTLMESESRESVTIRIHSPGGSTYEAMAIIARMRKSKCNIVTEGYGHVMSAATLILASGNRRRIDKHAQFMWHEASYEITGGRHSEHKDMIKQVEREEKMWANAMASVSNKDEKFWSEKGVGKDAYFNAEQLLELGVVDEVF